MRGAWSLHDPLFGTNDGGDGQHLEALSMIGSCDTDRRTIRHHCRSPAGPTLAFAGCRLQPGPRRSRESETDMSERLETLKKARERMADDRDAFAKTLAAPFDREKAERARLKFIETQVLIDAIDRAIAGEQTGSAAA
jgi:hypothetical protein